MKPILFSRTAFFSCAFAALLMAGCAEQSIKKAEAKPDIAVVDLAPNMAEAAGLDVPESRLAALEKMIAQLQTEVRATKAQLARLPEIENKLGLILAEMKGLKLTPPIPVSAPKTISPPGAKPDLKTKKAETKKPEPKKTEKKIDKIVDEALKVKAEKPVSSPSVTSVRIGEHKDKTRIVLEAGAPITYTTDVDNAEKIILVDLKNTGWNAAKEQKLTASPFVSSYAVQADGAGGQRLVITLKKPVKLKAYTIKAENQAPHRLVLDIASEV